MTKIPNLTVARIRGLLPVARHWFVLAVAYAGLAIGSLLASLLLLSAALAAVAALLPLAPGVVVTLVLLRRLDQAAFARCIAPLVHGKGDSNA